MAASFLHQRLNRDVDLLNLHQAHAARYPFLLESVATGTAAARFDILFAFPGDCLQLNDPRDADFLDDLDRHFNAERISPQHTDLPFYGGWFLFLAYELAQQVEPVLQLPRQGRWLPTALAVRCPAAVIRDHQQNALYLVAETEAAACLQQMQQDIQGLSQSVPQTLPSCQIEEEDPQRYMEGVQYVRDYIVEGDIFQANLSRGWQATFQQPFEPCDLYRQLRRQNPAPFAGLMDWQGVQVLSSSPERLLRVHNRVAETRPIAGTRPRGHDASGVLQDNLDEALCRELIGHPKERAEHVMLIDLERNDLGRVSQAGSVHVDELMVLESYAHVHHIVSNVRGRLRDEVTPGQAIRAVFPGGTITGCPKVRCMQIIAELEQTPREAYTGSMGYLNRDGNLDLNILIRSFMLRDRELRFRAGAGLVADSIAEKEVEETRAKARGLLMALQAT